MYIIQIQISIETLFEFLPPITTTSRGPHAEIRSRSVRNRWRIRRWTIMAYIRVLSILNPVDFDPDSI